MVMMMMTTAPHTHDDSIHLIESRRYADDDDDDDDDDGNDDNDGVDRGISQFHSTLVNYEYRRWLSALLPMRTGSSTKELSATTSQIHIGESRTFAMAAHLMHGFRRGLIARRKNSLLPTQHATR